jgi:Putative adhesin
VLGARAVSAVIDTGSGDVALGPQAQSRDIDTGSGSVTMENGARVIGGIDTGSGNVRAVGSDVSADIDTGSGNILLENSRVGGRAVTRSGRVELSGNTRINGSLEVRSNECGGWFSIGCDKNPRTTVVIGAGVEIRGPIIIRDNVILYVHSTARIGSVLGGSAIRFNAERP